MDFLNGRAKEPSTLNIGVTNITAFRDLIRQALEEADALKKTMKQLENFDLEIKFHVD